MGDLETYLRSLEMVLEVGLADDASIPRVAQLTQRTNQFNLTMRRHTEGSIAALCADPAHDVLTARLSDRFGDAGLIGVAVLRYEGESAVLDSFLLSCRALGRRVEDRFLDACLQRARLRGAGRALGEYRPGPRNGQVEDFFRARGFTPVEGAPPGRRFALELERWQPADLNPFARIEHRFEGSPGGERAPAEL